MRKQLNLVLTKRASDWPLLSCLLVNSTAPARHRLRNG
jgi:hypothetical protein